MSTLLHASGLTHGFSGRALFRNIKVNLAAGRITILRGDNGTGKTTLLRVLAGLMKPLAGQISIDGVDLTDDRVRAASKMVFIGHRDGLAMELTAGEEVRLWAQARGLSPRDADLEAAFVRLGLGASIDQPVRVLSAGQRRCCSMVRLALINAMGANATIPLWLLDEPTAAMDDTAVGSFVGLLTQHVAADGGVLVTSHLDLPLPRASRIILAELEADEVAE
jgi:heme exporter protein A